MSDLENWLRLWQDAVLSAFGGGRVRFLGIQGSRARGELWQFCLDTRPILGSLEPIAAQLTRGDIRESALTCAGAVYHGCVHARLHALDEAALGELMKTAFFALRAIHALKTGEALRTRAELAGRLDGVERDIALGTLPGTAEERAAALFNWSAAALRSL